MHPWRLRICSTRLGSNPSLAGLKTLNRLESVLARAEWSDPRIAEGLMLDGDENVVCGTMSNLFIKRGTRLITPLLDRCGVAGVMRHWILQTAPRLGLKPVERRVRIADVMRAEEVFMSNAVIGPMPVAAIGHATGTLRCASAGVAVALRARLESP
jgi:4-amino-4-deoxychorismate lyase